MTAGDLRNQLRAMADANLTYPQMRALLLAILASPPPSIKIDSDSVEDGDTLDTSTTVSGMYQGLPDLDDVVATVVDCSNSANNTTGKIAAAGTGSWTATFGSLPPQTSPGPFLLVISSNLVHCFDQVEVSMT
jgi:hypothetical protein